MIDPQDIHPLTDFQRNTKETLRRLKKTRRPQVLTLNGRPAAILQDPDAFNELATLANEAREARLLETAIREMEEGKGTSLADVIREIRAKRRPATRRKSA